MSEEIPRHAPPGEDEAFRPTQDTSSDPVEDLLSEAARELNTPAGSKSEDRMRELWNRMNQMLVNEGREPVGYDEFSNMATAAAADQEGRPTTPKPVDDGPSASHTVTPANVPFVDSESVLSPSLGAMNPNEDGSNVHDGGRMVQNMDIPQPVVGGVSIRRRGSDERRQLPAVSPEQRAALESQYVTLKKELDDLTAQGVSRTDPEMERRIHEFSAIKDGLRAPIAAESDRLPSTGERPWTKALSEATQLGFEIERQRKAGVSDAELEPLEKQFLSAVGQVENAKREPGGALAEGEWNPIDYLARRALAAGITTARYKQLRGLAPSGEQISILPDEEEPVVGPNGSANRRAEEPVKPSADHQESIVIPADTSTQDRLRELAEQRGRPKDESRTSTIQQLEEQAAAATDADEYWKIQGQIHDLVAGRQKTSAQAEFGQPGSSHEALRNNIAQLTERIDATDDTDTRTQLEMQRSVLQSKLNETYPLGDSRPIEPTRTETTAETTKPKEVVPDAAPEVKAAATKPATPDRAPTAKTPELKTESEPTLKLEHLKSLEDARNALAGAHRRERSWWSFGNKKELDRTTKQYAEALEKATRAELADINKEFSGRDLKDPKIQAEYTERLTKVAMEYRMTEEGRFRDALRGPEKQGLLDRFKTAWRKYSLVRMAASGGLIAVGSLGALTGQLWVTGMAVGARGALTGLGAGMGTESTLLTVGRAWERKFGATQELTPEQIAKITSTEELERRIAAHTLDTVEAHRKDFGKRDTGRGRKKREDRTAALLQERYGALLREQREQEITNMLKSGATVESVTEQLIASTLGERVRVHDAYIKRIGRNKALGRWRAGLGVAAGLLAGLSTTGGLRGVTNWVKEHWFDHAPDKPSFGIVSDEAGSAASAAVEMHPNQADYDTWVDKIKELSETPLVAKDGDSVWSLAEQHVDRAFGDLPPGQRTWIADRFKDAITKHPELVGLTDVNHLEVGQAVDFSKVDLNLLEEAQKAGFLPKETLESIVANDKTLDAWQAAHPNEMLTDAKVDDILHDQATPEKVPINMAISDRGAVTAESLSETTTPPIEAGTVPTTEVATSVPSAEATSINLTHDIAPDAVMSKATETMYTAYQTEMLNVPDHLLDPMRQGFEKISLQAASRYGEVESFLSSQSGLSGGQRELLATRIHNLALSMLESGHLGNESLAAALEWARIKH